MEPFTIAILYYSTGVIITTVSTYIISKHIGNVIYDGLEKIIDKFHLRL